MVQVRISYNTDREYAELMEHLEKRLEIKEVKVSRNRKPYKRAYVMGEWRPDKS